MRWISKCRIMLYRFSLKNNDSIVFTNIFFFFLLLFRIGACTSISGTNLEAAAGERVDEGSAARFGGCVCWWGACRVGGTSGDLGNRTRRFGEGRGRSASPVRAVSGRRRQPGGPRPSIPKGSLLCSRYHVLQSYFSSLRLISLSLFVHFFFFFNFSRITNEMNYYMIARYLVFMFNYLIIYRRYIRNKLHFIFIYLYESISLINNFERHF